MKPVHIRDPGVRGERPHGRTGRGRAVLRQSLGPDGRQDRGLTASVKVPVLLDCLANIECRVVATYPAGDHVLFIGEVVGGSLLKPDADPLVIRDWEWGRYVKTEGKIRDKSISQEIFVPFPSPGSPRTAIGGTAAPSGNWQREARHTAPGAQEEVPRLTHQLIKLFHTYRRKSGKRDTGQLC